MKVFVKKLSYVAIALFIFFMSLFAASYLLQPVLNSHRADFEKRTSDLLGNPVSIDHISVSWYGFQPEIRLNKVTILDKTSRAPVLQVQKIGVFLSIPKSIWQRQIVTTGFMVTGTDVHLHRDEKGEISVEEISLKNQSQQDTKTADVLKWLATERRLILRNIKVSFTDVKAPPKLVTLYDLTIENKDINHLITGQAILHQDIPTTMTLTVQWTGKEVDLAKIRARIYLYVSGLSLSQWLKDQIWQGWQIKDGVGSAKIWATWNHHTFRKIQSTFQLYGLEFYSATDKSTHKINRLSGNIGWKQDAQGQILAGDDLLIDFPSHLWPVSNFYVSFLRNAQGVLTPKTINIGYLNIKDAQAFLFSSPPFLSTDTQKMLTALQPQGALQNVVMTFADNAMDWQHVSLQAELNQISFSPWQHVPGLQRFSGKLKWSNNRGNIQIRSNRLILQDDDVFANAIPLDQLLGDVAWEHDESKKTWVIHTNNLQLLNTDLAMNIAGSLLVSNSSPIANLTANFTLHKANRITTYLPLKIFEPALVTWLRTAFLSGEVKSGQAILRGPLNEYPFADGKKGTFFISGLINNVDFHFAPDWPNLSHATGELIFSGQKMEVKIAHAQILGIPINNAYGVIPSLVGKDPAVLEVKVENIISDFSHALNFVHHSPLEDIFGKQFANATLTGPITLQLGLTVPLMQPEKTKVRGDLRMQNTEMNFVPWRLVINNITGQLQFTENDVTAKNIHAELFGKPLQLDLTTIQKNNNNDIIRASFSNQIAITDLENWLKIPFSKTVSGATEVKGEIDFSKNTSTVVRLNSNLVGIKVNLQAPYGKSPEIARDFNTEITTPDNQSVRIKLTYGDLGSAALILSQKKNEFVLTAANLLLGKGELNWPAGNGLYIQGNFDKLDWDKIKENLSAPDTSQFTTLPLRGLDIRAGVFELFGQRLTDIRLQVTPSPNKWDIDISSPQVVGHVEAPTTFSNKGTINAQFQRLRLQTNTQGQTQTRAIDVKTLPTINFAANNVSLNGASLGQVNFKMTPSGNGLTIQNIRITSPQLNLQASGTWSTNNTRLRGNLSSDNVGTLLSNLIVDAHNFIASNGKMNFDLSWSGAPFNPVLATLNGRANLNIGKGRIVDIGEASDAKMGIGRMLSIFSLQTIPRRLSLDFSDVFQKGYSFDYMSGDFTFRNGDAFTKNLRFDGPVARIDINGRIGLKNKDYNFGLSVTPYVSSSIPVAATLLTAGNPVVGIAAVAASTVLGSGISKVATHYYEVTGPWSNPTWAPVNSAKKN